jgi:parallel beta-helix repeat protein
MASGIRLFRSGNAPEPSCDYTIVDNVFTENKVAILVNRTEDVTLEDNDFVNNGNGVKIEEAGPLIRSTANRFTPPQP